MELQIDNLKKNLFQKNIAQSIKSVRIIKSIARILLLVGILGGGAYALLNFIVPSLSMVRVNGVLEKDTSWIIISTSFIVVPCLILAMGLNALSENLAGGLNSYRVDESIVFLQNGIKYSYRQKYQSTPHERRVVTLDFSKIHTTSWDAHTNLLCFSGEILTEYYDDYRRKEPVNIYSLEEFVICDYFAPNLTQALRTKGIKIRE